MQGETNFHLFWQCCYIQDLWSNVQEILTSNNIEIQLSYFNIRVGVNYKNKPKKSFKLHCTFSKILLFCSRYKLQRPTINVIKNPINMTLICLRDLKLSLYELLDI